MPPASPLAAVAQAHSARLDRWTALLRRIIVAHWRAVWTVTQQRMQTRPVRERKARFDPIPVDPFAAQTVTIPGLDRIPPDDPILTWFTTRDVDRWRQAMTADVNQFMGDMYEGEGGSIVDASRASVAGTTADMLGLPITFDLADPRVAADMAARTNIVVGLPDRLYRALVGKLGDAYMSGATPDGYYTTVRTVMRSVPQYRAERIARTEVTAGMNGAQHHAARQAGLATKTWLAVDDHRTRMSHALIDDTTVPINGRFANGLAYPGDPAAPPAETVNCRCTLLWGMGEGRSLIDEAVRHRSAAGALAAAAGR